MNNFLIFLTIYLTASARDCQKRFRLPAKLSLKLCVTVLPRKKVPRALFLPGTLIIHLSQVIPAHYL